jgi:hypothetical protein
MLISLLIVSYVHVASCRDRRGHANPVLKPMPSFFCFREFLAFTKVHRSRILAFCLRVDYPARMLLILCDSFKVHAL